MSVRAPVQGFLPFTRWSWGMALFVHPQMDLGLWLIDKADIFVWCETIGLLRRKRNHRRKRYAITSNYAVHASVDGQEVPEIAVTGQAKREITYCSRLKRKSNRNLDIHEGCLRFHEGMVNKSVRYEMMLRSTCRYNLEVLRSTRVQNVLTFLHCILVLSLYLMHIIVDGACALNGKKKRVSSELCVDTM